jgi:RsiW-degrading membrane proteinase PrsW (M82 family)
MDYLFLISLGLLPSFVWLSFYLRKDHHPEPNSMVIKIFIWGILIAPLAVFFELVLIWILNPTSSPFSLLFQIPQDSFVKIMLAATLVPALVEECLKYLVIRFRVLKSLEFDEPTDAVIYLIIVALGFAAAENLLVLYKIPTGEIGRALGTIGLRFLGATLVHVLASAIVGYWLARGLLELKKRKKFILIGLTIAILFHACYNYLIVTTTLQTETNEKLIYLFATAALLISAALIVSLFFKKLKNHQSICKTNLDT